MEIKKINDTPRVGLVNGLYATKAGLGGITIIQSKQTFSEKKFGLEKLTGCQGDVMKESMDCAFTVLNNILDKDVKKKFLEENEKFGIHIHCPDGSTQKDGPSAGMAIVTSIISLLINEKVDNTIAMTGEVNLQGDVTKIGGLFQKINGAKQAGVKTILIPHQNKNDYNLILQNKTYVASATQRLRVVLTWAIPFVLLSNVAMVANDEFAVLGIIPLISLPIVIFLAHKNEGTFLGLLLVITLISIAFTLFSVSSELATQALMTEGILTAFGLVLLSVPNEYYTKTPPDPEPDIHILPAFSVNNKKPSFEASEFEASEALIPKQIKIKDQ